ncbi:MAG: hypothetical protein Kow0098_03640 [Ignavibacteriaceae bacterium]
MIEKLTDPEDVSLAELDKRFDYHAPAPGQPEKYITVRATLKETAQIIVSACPESRERSIAITKLEEAMYWANAAIARHYDVQIRTDK